MRALPVVERPRDPHELTTAEAKRVLDELRDLQVFYINIGGGEPMVRRDFFELLDYSIGSGIGVKFSTNGTFIDADKARRLAAMDYLDIQISLDGIDAATNDAVRGERTGKVTESFAPFDRDAQLRPHERSHDHPLRQNPPGCGEVRGVATADGHQQTLLSERGPALPLSALVRTCLAPVSAENADWPTPTAAPGAARARRWRCPPSSASWGSTPLSREPRRRGTR